MLVVTSQPSISFLRRGAVACEIIFPTARAKTVRLADHEYIFFSAEYRAKYSKGEIARIPNLIGITARGFSALLPYNATSGLPKKLVASITLDAFVCPTYNTACFGTKQD